jgi:hypothetical protein
MRWLILAALLVGGCADFGLDQRRFYCADDPGICGDGQRCAEDGYCTAMDAPPIDAPVACDGAGECDDGNPCTLDSCSASGMCAHEPDQAGTCGAGCVCQGGVQTEEACGDGLDNDDDGAIDCRDSDCPACMGGLSCCDDGACRTSC